MGVLFAAFLRAPLTSVFMVLEVSGNYSIVLPVILANTIAYLISRGLEPVPILEQFTHQDGLYLPSMEELREESNLHLEDAIQPVTVPVLQGCETITRAAATLASYQDGKSAPVVLIHCEDGLWYSARKDELETLLSAAKAQTSTARSDDAADQPEPTLEQRLGDERTPVLFPDLPLSSALPPLPAVAAASHYQSRQFAVHSKVWSLCRTC